MNKVEFKERLRYFSKEKLDELPMVYMRCLQWKYKNNKFIERIVNENTDLVIEGFPRSANSFAVQAFKLAQQPNTVSVATHVHSPSHIIKAIKLNKPVLALIRDPQSTLISLRALTLQIHQDKQEEILNISFNHLASYYINFYQKLIPHQDHIVFAEFKQVINDFSVPLDMLNKKFSSDFKRYKPDLESKQTIFQGGGFHLSPSKERDNFKHQLESKFLEKCSKNLYDEMYKTYNAILEIIKKY